jgi:hypothetical protein
MFTDTVCQETRQGTEKMSSCCSKIGDLSWEELKGDLLLKAGINWSSLLPQASLLPGLIRLKD